jgi:hypothetical protein
MLYPPFMQHFMAAASPDSQLHVLPMGRHLQFCDADDIFWNALLTVADHNPEWLTKPGWVPTSRTRDAGLRSVPEIVTEDLQVLASLPKELVNPKESILKKAEQLGLSGRVDEVKAVCSISAAAMVAWFEAQGL